VASSKAYAIALGVALAASVTSLRNGFVYDDVPAILQDQRVHSLHHIPALLSEPYWDPTYANSGYRPATSVLFAVDWALGGGRPVVFHATNVLLHLAVVALVLALGSLVLTPAGALVAALWFAVQPVHVEAVANAVGAAELLAAAGYLGAVLAYVKDGDEGATGPPRGVRRGVLVLAVLAGAAIAFGAKEHALTLPAVLLLADAWRARARGEPVRVRLGRHALLLCGVLALALGYLVARSHAVGGPFATGIAAPGLQGQSVWGRSLIMAPAALTWLRWMVFPLHLSADYLPNAFVPRATFGPPQVAGFLVITLLGLCAYAARKRAPGVTIGIVWTIITASVAANIVVPTGVLLGERLAYLPSVGVALVAGAGWEMLPAHRLRWPLTAAVLALLAARSLVRIAVWHDEQGFLKALVRDAPDSYRTHWGLGAVAFKAGDFAGGEREMQAAIRINPADAALVQELGERYLEARLYQPADRYLTAAYLLDSLRGGAGVLAVLARLRGGRSDSAVALAAGLVQRFPDSAAVLGVVEQAYLAAGRPRQALAFARRLAYLGPAVWRYQQVAGYVAALNGRCEEARARLLRAASLAPAEPGLRDQLRLLHSGPECGLGSPPSGASARP
jgi:Flp pilus assembly protein TadD